jgi:hypothetical protein
MRHWLDALPLIGRRVTIGNSSYAGYYSRYAGLRQLLLKFLNATQAAGAESQVWLLLPDGGTSMLSELNR